MGRNFFGVEKGLDIFQENGPLLARILSGTAAPDGLGDQLAAPLGSLYIRSGAGEIYSKIASNGNAFDWKLGVAAAVTIGKWRGMVKVVTNDAVVAGVRDLSASPFSDDDGTQLSAADFVVGDFIIANAGATPVLLEVTNVSSPNVTFAAAQYPLETEDTFIAKHYLPDPDGFENKAIVNYNGSTIVKVSDIDWSIATGINLSGSYAAAAGNVLANDTVESAIAKIDGNVDALNTLSGLAQGATTLGSWASPVNLLFSATSSIKALFQRVGELLMQLRGVQVTGIVAETSVDEVPTATVKAVKWLVEVFEEATPANRQAFEIFALNNGSSVDDTQFAKLKVGASFNSTITVDLSGGNMRLRCASTSAGVTATARRLEVVKSLL